MSMTATLEDLKAAVEVIGLNLTPQEISDLHNGLSISIADRSLGEVGDMLLRTDAILTAGRRRISFGACQEVLTLFHNGVCKGVKIATIDDKCGLYYIFPFEIKACCEP